MRLRDMPNLLRDTIVELADDLLPPVSDPTESLDEDETWQADPLDTYCWKCGATAGPGSVTERGCSRCVGQRLPWRRIVRLGAYEPPLAGWIVAMKFHGRWAWADWLGRHLADAITDADDPTDRSDHANDRTAGPTEPLICPVPMHLYRRWWRGFNQAQLIADAIADKTGWPIVPALNRKSYTEPQTTVKPERRYANIRDSFALRPIDLTGHTVWLIDDVRTSGATLRACTRLLRQAGAERVNVAVIAVAD